MSLDLGVGNSEFGVVRRAWVSFVSCVLSREKKSRKKKDVSCK